MSLKLSQIALGGAIAPTTDTLVAVRSGASDVLVTPGRASAKSVSNNANPIVASVSTGGITSGHVATFADTAGTVQDGGVLGSAAAQTASSVTGTVAAVSGGVTAGHIAVFSDTAGTVQDGGAVPSGYTLPTATTSVLGGVKIDGTSITISGGVISASSSAPTFIAGSGTADASGSNSFAAGSGSATFANGVSIGNGSAIGGTNTTVIGVNANANAGTSIAIGYTAVINASSTNCIAIGPSTSIAGSSVGSICIGHGASSGGTGSVVIGESLSATSSNQVVIGSSTNSLGFDGSQNFTLTGNSGQLVATSVALTNHAASSAATMTNGPTAGNPTKWIAINDAGTTRYIPAW